MCTGLGDVKAEERHYYNPLRCWHIWFRALQAEQPVPHSSMRWRTQSGFYYRVLTPMSCVVPFSFFPGGFSPKGRELLWGEKG